MKGARDGRVVPAALLAAVLAMSSCETVVQNTGVEIVVSGVVTDDGVPQSNIDVGILWFGAEIPSTPSTYAKTDENGRYEISLRASWCALTRVYAFPDGIVPPWRTTLRGEMLNGCGPHVSDIDGWAQ